MAGARAATSLSTTLTVAAATLVVMGGILAGPAILDCARDGSTFGACLREKIADTGLVSPAGETIEKQTIAAEVPPVSPEPPVVAVTPRATGWLEANANEYQPKGAALVALTGAPGMLRADGSVSATSVPDAEVALAEFPGVLSASGSDEAASISALSTITAPRGHLSAGGRLEADPVLTAKVEVDAPVAPPPRGLLIGRAVAAEAASPSIEVALAGPVGELTASMAVLKMPPTPTALTLLPRSGALTVLGASEAGAVALEANIRPSEVGGSVIATPSIGAGAAGTSVALEANVSPEPLPADAELATGSIGPVASPPALAALEASAIPDPRPAPTRPAITFNPAFPNVLVLPPPNTGPDSSFATLDLN